MFLRMMTIHFQILLEEARESYEPDIVHELQSDSIADQESNLERIQSWMKNWLTDNSG